MENQISDFGAISNEEIAEEQALMYESVLSAHKNTPILLNTIQQARQQMQNTYLPSESQNHATNKKLINNVLEKLNKMGIDHQKAQFLINFEIKMLPKKQKSVKKITNFVKVKQNQQNKPNHKKFNPRNIKIKW